MNPQTLPEGAALVYGGGSRALFEAVPVSSRRILDVGCGDGSVGSFIKSRQSAEVVGLTYSQTEADRAARRLDRVVVCDLNVYDPAELGAFDCVICSHVLEHLYWPVQFLERLKPSLPLGGKLVVALPNVLAWRQRMKFLLGQFRYTDGGLMDRTHFRFFDWNTAQSLVNDAGYRIDTKCADGTFPAARYVPILGSVLNRVALRLAPGLFGWQFVIVAEPIREPVKSE